ncbi:unnamed protein product [Symbiodinium natans]|uniref:USP domain-containing protein n=1 Tax=Symbiodinium natans TaxID=878477 RepID=A0A812RZH1_9DINO|nr:unnamed protein product [Symbiodinium natans]
MAQDDQLLFDGYLPQLQQAAQLMVAAPVQPQGNMGLQQVQASPGTPVRRSIATPQRNQRTPARAPQGLGKRRRPDPARRSPLSQEYPELDPWASPWTVEGSFSRPSNAGPDHFTRDLMTMVTQLTLRQEDLLLRMAQDTTHVWTMKNSQAGDSVVLQMYQEMVRWRQQQQADRTQLRQTLRGAVLLFLLQQIEERHQSLLGDPTKVAALKRKGWLSQGGDWHYMRWESQKEELTPDTQLATMSPTSFLQDLTEIRTFLELSPEGLLHKFQATRRLTGEMQGPIVTFLSEISLRHASGDDLFHILNRWCGLASLLIVGLQIKQARPRRHALATAVLTSALLNPSNLCYVNTFAVSYAWCLAACEGDLCSFLGRSWEAFRVLLQRSAKPFQLTGLLSWRILLQGWSDITSQHDAAEFADFVLGRLERILCFGTWEAWFVQGGQLVRKFDQGLNRHIQVTVSPGEQSLADCIGAWATQEAPTDLEDIHLRHTPLVYMLCSPPPPFLLLQIKRFGNSMAGTQKMFAPVCSEAGRAYFIPVRVNAATVTLRAYYLIAVIYHLGETTTSGHYKCILHRYVTGRWMSWVTDDGRTAAVATKADLQTAACNSYLAWMQHASDIPDETMSLT